jgi:outer membrane protein
MLVHRHPLKPTRAALAVAIVWGALAFQAAQAQSLSDLFVAAKAYDATYLGALASVEAAQHRAAQTLALNQPSATLTSSPSIALSEVPPPVSRPGSGRSSGNTKTVDATLSGRYPLLNKATRFTIDQAQRSIELARTDVETAEQDLIIRLSQAYFNVLAAQDALATTRASKSAITEQLASARRNFEVGTATITDTREAQARFDLAVSREIAAENELTTRRIALDQIVGRAGITPLPLAVPAKLQPVTPGDSEAWVTQAENAHPAIRKATLALDVARLEIDKARAGKEPTLDAVGRLAGSHTSGSLASARGFTAASSVGLQFSWTLLNGGSTDNRIRETVALETKSRQDLEAAKRNVGQSTRQAFFTVQSTVAQVKALEAAESSSQLALEATQLGYKVGVRVNLDVLNAQTQLFETRQNLAKARYDVVLGELRLKQAAGVLAAGDLGSASEIKQK